MKTSAIVQLPAREQALIEAKLVSEESSETRPPDTYNAKTEIRVERRFARPIERP